MSSPISMPAVHPGLTFHVKGDRPTSHLSTVDEARGVTRLEEDDDEEEYGDDPQDRAVREMLDDDEAYRQSLELDEEEREELRSLNDHFRPQPVKDEVGADIPRTSSPELYESTDENQSGRIEPTTNGHAAVAKTSRFRRTNPIGGRTITIEEPRLSPDMEKGSYISPIQQQSDRPRRRRRSLTLTRSDTVRTTSSFTSVVTTAWERRHDPSHSGFWRAIWEWIVGKKEDSSTVNTDDPDYVPPKYRWTPILSGLLQPFSILLEIPGLTEHWYVRTEGNIPVVYQANPALLDVGLAISMASAVVANVALISRFLERRVFSSTITTIVCLTIHDIINLVAVTVFGIIHSVDDGFTYSEAFWLCVCSTAASMFTNATLIYDLIRTKDFRKSGSGLTPKQRSLVIISMLMLVYIAVGAMCFNFLLPATSFQNALYFTVVSIETIGFGDVTPYTIGAKIFLFFYVPLGILNLAVAVGTARDTLVESWNAAYRRRRHEVLRRHRIRKQQRAEEAVHKEAIEKKLIELGIPVYVNTRGGGVRGGAKGKKLNIRGLSMDQRQEAESEAISIIASRITSPPIHEGDNTSETDRQALDEAIRLQAELTSQSMLSEEGYQEFQERMAKEERTENLVKFAFALSVFILFWIIGATVFWKTEGWSWFIAFYFCFVAFTTVGYGEVSPQTPAGRAFFIIWAIFGVATVTLLIAVLTEAYANRYKSALVRKGTKKAIEALKDRVGSVGHPAIDGGEMSRQMTLLREPSRVERMRSGTLQQDKDTVERLPHELISLLHKFHTHVSASRHGAMEGHDTEPTRQLVAQLLDEQGLSEGEKNELMGDPESRRVVFWNGYERAVNALLIHTQSLLHNSNDSIENKGDATAAIRGRATVDEREAFRGCMDRGRSPGRTEDLVRSTSRGSKREGRIARSKSH